MTALDRIEMLVSAIGDDGCSPRKAIDYGEELTERLTPIVLLLREYVDASIEVHAATPNADGFVDTTRVLAADEALLAALRGEP